MKISLILGFLLVLFVTVLIADHMSSARRTELADVIAAHPQLVPQQPIAAAQPERVMEVEGVPSLPVPDAAVADAGPGGVRDVLATDAPVAARSDVLFGGEASVPLQPGAIRDAPPVEITLGRIAAARDVADAPRNRGLGPALMEVQRTVGRERQTADTARPGTPAAPVSPAATPPANARRHTIVAGDSAYRLAARFYGDGSLWRRLVEANPGRIGPEGQVRIGATIVIPSRESLGLPPAPAERARPEPARPRETRVAEQRSSDDARARPAPARGPARYVVRAGDTLGAIAQRELGSARRVDEIKQLNPELQRNPNALRAGTVLRLPARDA